jgi:hypothetical protein
MSRNKSFTERLKNMKESIEKNKDLLNQNFPDDVTTTGNPDLIRDKDKSNPENNSEGDDDETAGN